MSNVKLIEFLPFESLSFFDKLVLTLLFTIALDKLEISVDQYKKTPAIETALETPSAAAPRETFSFLDKEESNPQLSFPMTID